MAGQQQQMPLQQLQQGEGQQPAELQPQQQHDQQGQHGEQPRARTSTGATPYLPSWDIARWVGVRCE